MPLADFISLTEPFGPPSPPAPLSDTTTTRVFSSCSALPRTDPWPGATPESSPVGLAFSPSVERQVVTCLWCGVWSRRRRCSGRWPIAPGG